MKRDNDMTVSIPTWVLMGLIRNAEFNEQHGITVDGKLWDDSCRNSLEYVRESGLRHEMMKLHGPSDYENPRIVRSELPY
jgi:hypothetical protein